MDDVERHLAEQMAVRLRTRIEEFESLKMTGPEPAWVGAKVELIRRLLADLENAMADGVPISPNTEPLRLN